VQRGTEDGDGQKEMKRRERERSGRMAVKRLQEGTVALTCGRNVDL
jgi:hypothetical protein